MSTINTIILVIVGIVCAFLCIMQTVYDGDFFDGGFDSICCWFKYQQAKRVLRAWKKGDCIPLFRIADNGASYIRAISEYEGNAVSEQKREDFFLFVYLVNDIRVRMRFGNELNTFNKLCNIIEYTSTDVFHMIFKNKVNMPEAMLKEIKSLNPEELSAIYEKIKDQNYLSEQLRREV